MEHEQRAGNYVAGYLAYEAGAAFGLAAKTVRSRPFGGRLEPDNPPLAWMGVYRPSTVRRVSLSRAARARGPEALHHGGGAGAPAASARAGLSRSSLSLSQTQAEYSASIGRVRDYIAAGDTYQVNYTVRARFELDSDPLEYFLSRAARHPVPYSAFLDLGSFQVVSLSPELFLRRCGDRLESRPMKGTRPRGATPEEDIALGYELVLSAKDRAENLMIVDMVRNDLGRVCRTGSVHVPSLFALEPYGTVWQMASTVIGEPQPEATLADIIAATFPGASVTGAPKHHTMEIIRDLESEPRGAYTGTVCLFLPGGDFTCNLAIRTIVHRDGGCLLGVGSGVVWDSDAQEEYDETWAKTAFVFSDDSTDGGPATAEDADAGIFETVLLHSSDGAHAESGRLDKTPGGPPGLDRYLRPDDHLARMAASASALGLPFDHERAVKKLTEQASLQSGSAVVRLDLGPSGGFSVVTRPAPTTPTGPVRLLLSPFRTDPCEFSLRHKTRCRPLYDREHARAVEAGCFDALFINLRDHVTEGAITNLFARFGGRWITPPLTDGLLPGIWRARFIADVGATERPLTIEDLLAADEVVVGNSVRGRVAVSEILELPW